MSIYGECECCGVGLLPVWFEERESKIEYGSMVWTNRYRKAVSHLTCGCCLRNYCVDDSFDGDWYIKS